MYGDYPQWENTVGAKTIPAWVVGIFFVFGIFSILFFSGIFDRHGVVVGKSVVEAHTAVIPQYRQIGKFQYPAPPLRVEVPTRYYLLIRTAQGWEWNIEVPYGHYSQTEYGDPY